MNIRFILPVALFALVLSLAGCGDSAEDKRAEAELAAAREAAQKAPAVYGKVKSVTLDAEVNLELARKGEKIFTVTCAACHKLNERYVGPALGDVVERRTPEYIMNMILDTDVMLEKDDTARCLLQTYLTRMPNAQVNEDDARNVLEHLRAVASKN